MEKWYFDALAADHDFIYCYFTRISFSRYTEASFVISWYRRSRDEIQTRAFQSKHQNLVIAGDSMQIETPCSQFIFRPGQTVVDHRSGNTILHLDYSAPVCQPGPAAELEIRGRVNQVIRWRPLNPGATVNGEISFASCRANINQAKGYIDYLSSTTFPLFLYLKTLVWGRIIHDQLDLTFTIVDCGQSGSRARVFLRLGTEVHVLEDITMTTLQKKYDRGLNISVPADITIKTANADVCLDLHLQMKTKVSKGNFINRDIIDNPLKRSLFRILSMNPRGHKYLSDVRIVIDSGGQNYIFESLPSIAEFVIFK